MRLIDQVHESWPQVSNQSLRNPESGNSSMQGWWAAVNWRVEFDQVIGISIPSSSSGAQKVRHSFNDFSTSSITFECLEIIYAWVFPFLTM